MDGLTALFDAAPSSTGTTSVEGHVVLSDAGIGAVEDAVLKAVRGVSANAPGGRVVLVLDGLDALLAMAGKGEGEGGVEGMIDLVGEWREVSYERLV